MDLWTLSMSGNRTRNVFVSSKQNELNGTFSPDGRWVAFAYYGPPPIGC